MPKRVVLATLNPKLIEETIRTFPRRGNWRIEHCRGFHRHAGEGQPSRVNWRVTGPAIPDAAGLYAFLFPVKEFQPSFSIKLHGPSRNGAPSQIPFEVDPSTLKCALPKHFVAYVGRSANIRKRLRLHFHTTRRTTAAQVRESLCRLTSGHVSYYRGTTSIHL